MSNSSIEMVAKKPSEDDISSPDRNSLSIEQADEIENASVFMKVIRRQSKWCGCSLILVLSSLVVFLVGRIYMTSDGVGADILPLSGSEQGGTVNNDAVKDSPTRNHIGVIGSLLRGNATTNDRNKSGLQTWMRQHGHLSPNAKQPPTPPTLTNHTATNETSSSSGEPSTDPIFDTQKWHNSKVTLDDGVMFRVERELSHDSGAFLEGLTFSNGSLYESTGLIRQSSIRRLDPDTGDVIESYFLEDKTIFGEGLAAANGKLYQLTYKKKMGFIYDINNISQPVNTFAFESTTGEGWGLTYADDSDELIMSDGSDVMHMINPETLTPTRTVKVLRDEGKPANNINELEYFHGRVLANVWYQDIILVINPLTGVVEKEYDFSTLWLKSERSKKGADVLNGISTSSHPGCVYVTGKNWEKMFLVE
ncbi:hypothetical protein MPSEU_000490500 [Mayamaea pseudoterrestris]|nr:hypothetical protein MPSEU_000490500 [Mayamaea pseudoterrestris]